jgi:hypothetical protein
MRSLGVAVALEKNEANSSLARSSSKSGSLGSVMTVSSYSRWFSRVAGIFVFNRSCYKHTTENGGGCTSLSFGSCFSA